MGIQRGKGTMDCTRRLTKACLIKSPSSGLFFIGRRVHPERLITSRERAPRRRRALDRYDSGEPQPGYGGLTAWGEPGGSAWQR